MKARTKGILVGLFVLIVPAIFVLYINYYMMVRHPELLARGTTATVTARDDSQDKFVFHYQVDDPKAAGVIKKLSNNTEDLTYEVKRTDENKDWNDLKVGNRFCIV